MTYELTKELKDAGFPILDFICEEVIHTADSCEHCRAVTPNLSELIKACGDRFYSIFVSQYTKTDRLWIAETFENDWIQTSGKTPEEAVAKLWLTLNKKTNV